MMVKKSRIAFQVIIFAMLIQFVGVQSSKGYSGPNPDLDELYKPQYNLYQVSPLVSGSGSCAGFREGVWFLLDGKEDEHSVIAFERTAEGPHQKIRASFDLRIKEGVDGASFVLLSTSEFGIKGQGPMSVASAEPNVKGSFAIGFDTHNPPTDDPFDADGNINGEPEREVSLHWDGIEVANRLSPVEFRDVARAWVYVIVDYVIGGAKISVSIEGTPIYDDYFIPLMKPYESRVAFGASSGDTPSVLKINYGYVSFFYPVESSPEPLRTRPLDKIIILSGNPNYSEDVTLPGFDEPPTRIILTLTLEEPPGGIDDWDRGAAVYAWNDDDERIEILRYITPFGRGYIWHADVTDYQSILQGETKMGLNISTWQKGWMVTVDLSYFEGEPEREAYLVENLWVGSPEYGNPDNPMNNFFEPKMLTFDDDVEEMKLRFVVTGHGMNPATNNAAEFMLARRTVKVGGMEFRNLLWTTDAYLNPCRPQGGTWKYSRAGWGPGSIVRPWDIEITELIEPGEEIEINYIPMHYINENRDKSHPIHWVESQIIYYR